MTDTSKDTEKTEAATVEVVQETAISLITKAEIDMQISTAQAFPRSMQTFLNQAREMATLTMDIAESCAYSLPRGGKFVEGPSVRLAEIVASCYGNLRTGARVIFNDGKVITAQGIVHDLQKNIMHTEEVQRSIQQNEWEPDPNKPGKNRKTGKMITMTEDMQIVTGRAACAIAYRNAVFKVVPAAIIQDLYDLVKETAKGSAETLVVRRDRAMAYFKSLGVKDEQIFQVLEVKGLADIGLDELQKLTGMKAAIKNGEASVESLFFTPNPKDKADKATKNAEDKLNKKTGNKAADTTAGIDEKLKGADQPAKEFEK
jgi:hypothetical protein